MIRIGIFLGKSLTSDWEAEAITPFSKQMDQTYPSNLYISRQPDAFHLFYFMLDFKKVL